MKVLRKQVGQLLIAGLEGMGLSALEKSWLRTVEPGGVILFRRNIEEPGQTYQLLADAGAVSTVPLFNCVDLEGGLVDRLRDLIAPMPSLAAVAATGKKSLYRKHGKLIGREAYALGFNTVFAPVLDLALAESRQVMRTRTFFSKPEEVVSYGKSFLQGLASAGILGCAKHFPGLGGGDLDSHHATPIIERSWNELWGEDLLPYRQLKPHLSMIMVAHASYPRTGDRLPASVSPHWIGQVLGKRIGYRGLVISDDMEMGGILTHTSIENAAIQALLAGTHLIEICKDPALLLRAYEALLGEAEGSGAFRKIVSRACRQVMSAKGDFGQLFPKKPPSPSQTARLRADVAAFREMCPEPEKQGA